MSGASMEPTLTAGEVVRVFPVPGEGVPRGSVLAYRPPHREDGVIYIHRCVAVEGDTFSIKNGQVYLNGIVMIEKYTAGKKTNPHTSGVSIDGVVPENTIIVLGDNRENAQDSRYFGYLPVKNVVGIVRKIQ